MYSFFAMISRMKYIKRWALMRNSRDETVSEHSLEVAILAHALATLGNKRLGKKLPADRAALLGLFHDCTEILTGDMPTPVKYRDSRIRSAYKEVEEEAADKLICMLPEDLREEYEPLLKPEEDTYLWRLVKAADTLSALIKCMEEEKAGNREFFVAGQSTRQKLRELQLAEVDLFMEDFAGSYEKSLDEL